MDQLETMAAFVAVADQKGFAAAARRLGVSPSSVTRMVASLEERLDVQLLARTTRSVRVTEAGARYLERARRVLADVQEAKAAARAEGASPSGRFVVAAPATFGRRFVAPLVSTFLARHPAVRAELLLSDRVVDLIEEGVDVAVRIGSLEDSTLRVRAVGATRRVLVASDAYLAKRGAPRTPAALASHPTIQFTSLTPFAEWRFSRRGREQRVPIRPALATNSAEVAAHHAESGGGIAMLLSYQVFDSLEAGRLRVVLASYEPPPIPIQIVYPATRAVSAALRAFVDLAAAASWRFVGAGRRV